MSLINEALKKAQRQRTLESAPLSCAPSGVAAAAVTTHVRAASHHRTLAPLWFGLGLLATGAGATALILHYGVTPATKAPVASDKPTVTTPTSGPALPVKATPPEPLAAVTLPPLTAPHSAPASPPPAPTTVNGPETPADPVIILAGPAAPSLPPAPAPLDPTPRIRSFLAAARITGVRGREDQARVLMNEKVFRLNDTVEQDLGLRLSGVRAGVLVFTDALGHHYEKKY